MLVDFIDEEIYMRLPEYLQDKCYGPEVSMNLQHARVITSKGNFLCHINSGREIGYVEGHVNAPFDIEDILDLIIIRENIDMSKYADYLEIINE